MDKDGDAAAVCPARTAVFGDHPASWLALIHLWLGCPGLSDYRNVRLRGSINQGDPGGMPFALAKMISTNIVSFFKIVVHYLISKL